MNSLEAEYELQIRDTKDVTMISKFPLGLTVKLNLLLMMER